MNVLTSSWSSSSVRHAFSLWQISIRWSKKFFLPLPTKHLVIAIFFKKNAAHVENIFLFNVFRHNYHLVRSNIMELIHFVKIRQLWGQLPKQESFYFRNMIFDIFSILVTSCCSSWRDDSLSERRVHVIAQHFVFELNQFTHQEVCNLDNTKYILILLENRKKFTPQTGTDFRMPPTCHLAVIKPTTTFIRTLERCGSFLDLYYIFPI